MSRHTPIRTAWLARPVHGIRDDGTVFGSCKKCGALATLSPDDQIKCKDGCSHADSAATWLAWHRDFERRHQLRPSRDRPCVRSASNSLRVYTASEKSPSGSLDVEGKLRNDIPYLKCVV
jgi:hypothetical protein